MSLVEHHNAPNSHKRRTGCPCPCSLQGSHPGLLQEHTGLYYCQGPGARTKGPVGPHSCRALKENGFWEVGQV